MRAWQRSLVLVLAFWGIGAAAPEEKPPERFVRCSFAPIPKKHRSVSTFDALAIGKDGVVYMGTSNYGSPALLVRYDPKDGSVAPVCDVSSTIGEDPQHIVPSGKVHSPLCVSSTGMIYFGSHLGDDRCMTGESPHPYGGGHFMCYDPATGRAEDLGVAYWPESVMRVELDEQRALLYGMTYPGGHLIVKDLTSGMIADKGQAAHSGYAMPMVFADRMVYFFGRPGRVCRYDPDADVLKEVIELPPLPNGERAAVGWEAYTSMSGVAPDRSALWGTVSARESGQRFLYRFRCPETPDGDYTFEYVASLPPEASIAVPAPNGEIYLFQWNLKPRLFYFDQRTKETLDLGALRDAQGRVGVAVWTSTFANDGTLYLGGLMDVPEERFDGSGYGYGALGFFSIRPEDLKAAVEEARK